MTVSVNGEQFAEMLRCGAARLARNVQIINELNVFPIPDGDTGDNMLRTLADALSGFGEVPLSFADAAALLSERMVETARGNSGVILSRFFAGVALAAAGESSDTGAFLACLQRGGREAYSAVLCPKEGTILTCMREAAQKLAEGEPPEDFETLLRLYVSALSRSLGETPEKLQVLKDNGVVDSGGAGFLTIVEGMTEWFAGGGAEALPQLQDRVGAGAASDTFGPDTPMPYGYCTELVLQLRSDAHRYREFSEQRLREELSALGDSVVCFRDGMRVKLHVHTFQPEQV